MIPPRLRRQAIRLAQLAYGNDVTGCLAELNQTQWLSREELLALQQQKLLRVLRHAYRWVPYYQRLFDGVGFRPDDILSDPSAFQKIPTLSKSAIKDNFDDLITTAPRLKRQLTEGSTGGSTGRTMIYVRDKAYLDYVLADDYRHMGWFGWELGECQAWLWGHARELDVQQSVRGRLIFWLFNRIVTNAFALNEESMTTFARAIQRRRPKVLVGYASALERFAQFVQDNRLADITFAGVISQAEMLYPDRREIIKRAFCCDVLDRYGTRELGGIGCECPEHTGLHLSVEDVFVEIVNDGRNAPIGEEGEIVATGLTNYGMPLIRYELEDVGQLSDRFCPCGRSLPMMEIVHGRISDMFKTRNGTAVHGLAFNKMFRTTPEVKQFQVVQKSLDRIVVTLVENRPIPAARLDYFEHAIQEMMGSEVDVEIDIVDSIPILPSGKYRATMSEVS